MLIDIDIIVRVFNKKYIYQMSINRRRTIRPQGADVSLEGILSFFSLSLLVKSFEEEIQPSGDFVDTARG